ncbi:MAG TPA: zf-HC2 domain-containing protein [Actinomycetota bacterium]|nr:zf-HC2 domain-containing protein [Actinomycetota bacterium]
MSDHPDILLAEYVEGTLPPDARAEVDAHVLGCDRCRREIELAEEARSALVALPDVPAPEGLPLAVRRRTGRRAPPRATRWLAGAAAAAVLATAGILVFRALGTTQQDAVVVEQGAGRSGAEEQEGSTAAPTAASPEAASDVALAARPTLPTYTESDRDYTRADLVPLGRAVRDRAREALQQGVARTATTFYAGFDPAAFTTSVTRAIECSLQEVPPEQLLVPFSIEAASFEGEPAYVAAFLQGPAPHRPYDRVVLWVVARDSCSLRSLASQRL